MQAKFRTQCNNNSKIIWEIISKFCQYIGFSGPFVYLGGTAYVAATNRKQKGTTQPHKYSKNLSKVLIYKAQKVLEKPLHCAELHIIYSFQRRSQTKRSDLINRQQEHNRKSYMVQDLVRSKGQKNIFVLIIKWLYQQSKPSCSKKKYSQNHPTNYGTCLYLQAQEHCVTYIQLK